MTTAQPLATQYTFTVSGTDYAFVRRIEGRFEEWFSAGNVYDKSSVLAAGSVIIDVGGAQFRPLILLAEFTTPAERATFKALLYNAGTLSNDLGRSASVVMVNCDEPSNGDGRVLLECTFEKYQ